MDRLYSHPKRKVAFKEAKKKAQFILDVLSLEEIYQPVEAPTRAKHSLPTYRCARVTESKLELFHANQAMFGNMGMLIGLIDRINHAGLVRHNTKTRPLVAMDGFAIPRRKSCDSFLFLAHCSPL
jgi:hypothetical protein